jgi:phosphate transport system substrate-binding protein
MSRAQRFARRRLRTIATGQNRTIKSKMFVNSFMRKNEGVNMRHWFWAVLLMTALLVAACGGGAAPAAEEAVATEAPAEVATEAPAAEAPAAEAPAGAGLLPAVNPLEVSGDIIVAGSSTVYPLTERMAERFRRGLCGQHHDRQRSARARASSASAWRAETDIANASRAIAIARSRAAQPSGATPIEFRVGTDALAVVVNPENDWIGAEG